MRTAVLFLAVSMLGSCNSEAKPISDVPTCVERVKTKLYMNRNLILKERDRGPEFYVLEGSSPAAQDLAVQFMERNGWHGWASDKPEDQNKFHFVPDLEPYRPGLPIGALEDGPQLACQASKLSGLTFTKVVRRSKSLEKIIYEFEP